MAEKLIIKVETEGGSLLGQTEVEVYDEPVPVSMKKCFYVSPIDLNGVTQTIVGAAKVLMAARGVTV